MTEPRDPQGTEPVSEPAESNAETGNGNREAAKYRTRARDAEAERDALRERVANWQRAEIERLATAGDKPLADGADLWRAGVEIGGLLDESGNVDPAKVTEAVTTVLGEHPHWERTPAFQPNPGQGQPSGGAKPPRLGAIFDRAGA